MGDLFTTRFDLKGPSSGNCEHLQNNKLFQLPCITLHTTYMVIVPKSDTVPISDSRMLGM